ncbi:MAG TPA: DUF364 domain-containing protein [Arachnia sp.]|nr:DUF364 domain-containing protein [Arachnia sp.]HMT84783.1 DUF364 domain-containing protein [Arachnia sp.]
MQNPWQIYDELIDPIPAAVTVTAAAVGPRWCRVASSDRGLGAAYALPEGSRPVVRAGEEIVGAPLREIAALAKSWNFVEAGIGMAAINAWHCRAELTAAHGFTPCAINAWERVFHPYSDAVAGKIVSVIGHFPFAPEPLARAAELRVLERSAQAGDYPDSACEYLLPDSDFVFISGSAFVNKTMPRLLHLSREATTVVLGPSTPLSTTLFEHGADVVTGFVPSAPAELFDALGGPTPKAMYDHGYRVERAR